MNFITPVELPAHLPCLRHTDHLLLLGSCFAANMGARFTEAKFSCDVNPYGVLYNPLSISAALREIVFGKVYGKEDLFFFRDCWHSPMHHGDFSSPLADETLKRINGRIAGAHEQIFRSACLLLTFGTSWVYEQKNTGRIVGNCHKLPEKEFTRRRLTVDEIVSDYVSLLSGLLARNSGLKVIFTVSPIRHVREGMHANQLSKSVLLLAVDRLQAAFPENVFYFPAYELVLDELRDYRFYGEDMLHISSLAVEYIWEKFKETWISPAIEPLMKRVDKLNKSLAHRPFSPESDAYRMFQQRLRQEIETLQQMNQNIDFTSVSSSGV